VLIFGCYLFSCSRCPTYSVCEDGSDLRTYLEVILDSKLVLNFAKRRPSCMVLPCGHFVGGFVGVTKCHKKYMGCMLTLAPFGLPHIRLVFFQPEQCFSLTIIHPEQCFFSQFQPRFSKSNGTILKTFDNKNMRFNQHQCVRWVHSTLNYVSFLLVASHFCCRKNLKHMWTSIRMFLGNFFFFAYFLIFLELNIIFRSF